MSEEPRFIHEAEIAEATRKWEQQRAAEAEIVAGLDEPIRRVRTSIFYRVGLLLAAAVMLLLIAAYLGIIAGAVFGLGWHAVHTLEWVKGIENPVGRLWSFVFLYIGPLGAGPILIFFLFKPLLARFPVEFDSIEIERGEEPALWDFAERICRAVRAPKPHRIFVDCQINASAGFDRGWMNFLRGRLVLTVGMPLVAGFTARELAGVLAHEFGHFSQGTAMRVNYLVWQINAWFVRVVFQHDIYDRHVYDYQDSGNSLVAAICGCAALMIMLVRLVLFVLMLIGFLFCFFLLRQMERNADDYELRLAGTDTTLSTWEKFILYTTAFEGVVYDLQRQSRAGALPDDVASFIAAKVEEMPKGLQEKTWEKYLKEKRHPFRTHPVTRSRVNRAWRRETPGVYRCPVPARTLFRHYEQWARLTSVLCYRTLIGPRFNSDALVPTEPLLEARRNDLANREALRRFFQNVFSPIFLPAPETVDPPPLDSPKQTTRILNDARDRMFTAVETTRETLEGCRDAFLETVKLQSAQLLFKAGVRVSRKEFGIESRDPEDLETARRRAFELVQQSRIAMRPFEELAETRLRCAMQLLHHKEVRRRVSSEGIDLAQGGGLWTAWFGLGRARNSAIGLQEQFMILATLAGFLQRKPGNEKLCTAAERTLRKCQGAAEQLHLGLSSYPYPFEGLEKPRSLGEYIAGGRPRPDDLRAMVQISQCLDSYFSTYYRVLGRLAAVAESVETALGIQRWPDPAAEDGDQRSDWTESSVFGELSPELPEWWWAEDEIVG